jgi:hypothetical protein
MPNRQEVGDAACAREGKERDTNAETRLVVIGLVLCKERIRSDDPADFDFVLVVLNIAA